jgi:ATP-binding cassette subfamily B protein
LRIFGQCKGFGLRITGLFALTVLETPLFLLAPIPLALAVDSVLGSDPVPTFLNPILPDSLTDHQLLIAAALLQLVIVLITNLHTMTSEVLRTATSERITQAIRSRLFGRVQQMSFAFHDKRGVSDSLYRIQYDAPAMGSVIVDALIPMASAAITLVFVFIVIFRINAELAVVAIAISPFLMLLAARFRRAMRTQFAESKQLDSSAMAVVSEALGTFRVVKAFGREQQEQERFARSADHSIAAKIKVSWTQGFLTLMVDLITAFGTAAVLYIGVRDVQSNALTLGDLLIVMSYLARLYAPLGMITRKTADLQESLASATRGFDIIDRQPEIRERPHAAAIARAKGEIAFRDVSFAYGPDAPLALDGITFSVAAGTRVGIAGRTGAGKSTLVSLLLRFYDPVLGSIELDGRDLREYRLEDLRRQFALVLQEPVLFSTSVRENIAYGRLGAGLDEIRAAAAAAGADDFVMRLPDGYDTLVGERGMRLSGGERQRISVARAFLKDAPILVLDEPTSSVDIRTEAEMMATTERLMQSRTTFMIAHRLSTLDYCDVRLTIDGGRVVEGPVPSSPDWRHTFGLAETSSTRSMTSGTRRIAPQGDAWHDER